MDDEMTPRSDAEVPAAGGRLLLGWILIGVATIMLIAGWIGVSANPHVPTQLSYFASGGLGGLLAGIIGVGLLVSDDVRRDRARIGRLEAAVLELRELLVAQSDTVQDLAEAANGSAAKRGTRTSGRS